MEISTRFYALLGTGLVLVGIIYISLFFIKLKRKRRLQKLRFEEMEDKKEQEYIARILEGNYTALSKEQKNAYNTAFAIWWKSRKKLFTDASWWNRFVYWFYKNKKMEYDFKSIFSWESPVENKNTPAESCRLLIQNAFTEAFPSSYDMPSFFLGYLATDILVLQGISESESEKYYFHAKEYFVNHDMLRGIICVDVYKIL